MGTEVSEKLVIKRKQWMNSDYNRKNGTNSVLWSEERGVGCYLGHYLRMKGFGINELDNIGEPLDLSSETTAGLVCLDADDNLGFHPDWVEKAMSINDKLPSTQAEPKLIALFKEHANCVVTFEN
jgi:hypothetical protein